MYINRINFISKGVLQKGNKMGIGVEKEGLGRAKKGTRDPWKQGEHIKHNIQTSIVGNAHNEPKIIAGTRRKITVLGALSFLTWAPKCDELNYESPFPRNTHRLLAPIYPHLSRTRSNELSILHNNLQQSEGTPHLPCERSLQHYPSLSRPNQFPLHILSNSRCCMVQ